MKTVTAAIESERGVAWGLLIILALGLLMVGLGRMPFIDRDEGEYATVAQEMIDRSDYVIPHVNGRPYYEKPALHFWLMAGAFELFGRNETAGRLPSAVAGLALVFVVGWFGRRRGGDTLGILAALFLVTSFLFTLLARAALLDLLLTLWTTLTLVLFYEGYDAAPGKGRWYFRCAWVAMGLAFLTKGPVGVVVPMVAVLPTALLNREILATLKRIRIPSGVLLFLVAAAPWYTLAFLREGRLFWEGFFISQNVTRFTEVLLGHGAPLWFYIPVLAILVWPWFFFALPVVWRGLFKNPLARRRSQNLASLDFFLSLWFLTSLVLFSVSATKQPNYILPALPPLALLAARWWQDRLAYDRPQRAEVVTVMTLVGLIGLALAGFLGCLARVLPLAVDRARAGINPDSFEYAFPPTPPNLGAGTLVVGILLAAVILVALGYTLARRKRKVLALLAVGGVVFVVGMWHVTVPPIMDYLQTPARTLAYQVRGMMQETDRLAAFGLYKPTLWFYAGHHIERIRSQEVDQLRQYLGSGEKGFILSRLTLLPVLSKEPNFHLIRTEGGYLLGANHPVHTGAEGQRAP